MILVDTSVLIDALRKNDSKLQQLFVIHGAAICGIIRAGPGLKLFQEPP